MKRFFSIFIISILVQGYLWGQGDLTTTKLDATSHDSTFSLPSIGMMISDDDAGGGGQYSEGHDYWMTVCGQCAGQLKLTFSFETFDVARYDTVFIYDGPDINSPLIAIGNNHMSNLAGRQYFVSATNTSGCLTIRFKTNTDGNTGLGFQIKVNCQQPCETVLPIIEEVFYKVRNNVVYDSAILEEVEVIDTVTGDKIGSYISANICDGDCIILKGRGEYTHYTGYYDPSDATSTFTWSMSTSTQVGLNMTEFTYCNFPTPACYEVSLKVMDERGCGANQLNVIRVRIAKNPIEKIDEDLAVFCNDTCVLVTTSVSADSIASTLIVNPSPAGIVSKDYNARTFIPDGLNCNPTDPCYNATIEFSEFPPGRTIQTAEDICSVCVTYEHSFMGDYDLNLVCPSGQKATLKYYQQQYGYPTGTGGGGGTYTGYPYGGNNDGGYDANGGSNCDSIYNMYGVGLEYCFSRNSNYLLVDGLAANTTNTTSPHYLANTDSYIDNVTYTFPPIPQPYYEAGTTCGTSSFSTKHPSNHEGKYDYYLPADDFSQLIGCPLNGSWSIQICDNWNVDNGWVFSWSMDICDMSTQTDCQYTVGIDSIRWAPDYSIGGIVATTINNDSAYISTPDTAGSFPVMVHVYDDFGCVWDTSTFIRTSWTPEPFIGNDTSLCDPESILLNATDPHDADGEFSYSWEPFGDTTAQIWTTPNLGVDTNYIVTVVNSKYGLACTRTDTLRVSLFPMPIPGFTTNVLPPAGCSPFEIQFVDTSKYAAYWKWNFGDGYGSNLMSPYHYYSAGHYNVSLIVTTDFGCVDSIEKTDYVWVFNSPDAQFTWEPEFPTYNSPTVQLQNLTTPMVNENQYEWYIQTEANSHNFWHTSSKDPTYTWSAPIVADDYHVKLISHTDNYNQNGELVVCKDSVETTIMLIQDFIQFPSVVTPNGDGINDRFVIHGLIDGLAYQNNILHIYNRWGALVYSKNNITLDEDCWDPAAERAPAGTYFFYFSADGYGGKIQRTGSFEVMKH